VIASERARFLGDYGHIRAAEGRGSEDSTYYRALPYADLTGRNTEQWRIRARSFDYFAAHILPRRPSDILDLGAGNCWLSYRLAERKHRPIAVDIFTDARDGLGAAVHYPTQFPVVEAEFDHLPFADQTFDLAVFASSIHYSTDYAHTLGEARRCLRPGGRVVILDTPIYRERAHGEMMRAERHAGFERQYGFRSDAVASIEYFDRQMLADLARELSLEWEIHRPWYGWRWHLRPVKAQIERRRPPSRFWILVASFNQR
jgi:SAM-dependent methyltransferase